MRGEIELVRPIVIHPTEKALFIEYGEEKRVKSWFHWNPYKNAEQISVRRVKEILLNTDFDRIQPEDGGKAKYHNGVFLSVKKT